ncbi:MAG: hypothetical protein K6T91_08870 [Firmicutes bacterium]|nr:hypothetical protein [Bacillota bacterium]
MYMGFEPIVIVLSVALLSIPVLTWVILRKISAADKARESKEELRSLENSLSLLIKELQDSVQKALADMENSADRLSAMIEKADDRIRQLQYYYEYGEELRPLVTPQPRQNESPIIGSSIEQSHVVKHKEVHELSRKGWSPVQIAKHTGMSADEVQLIVNLMEISTMDAQLRPQQETQQPPQQYRQPMV